MDHFDLHRIFGVVEVNDMDVKDQNSRAGDEFSCGGNTEIIWTELLNEPKTTHTRLTDSCFAVRHVRRDGYPPLLSRAQTLQGLIHPLDHISQANVRVIGAVALITDEKKKQGGFILLTL